jgi:hypothetical protein
MELEELQAIGLGKIIAVRIGACDWESIKPGSFSVTGEIFHYTKSDEAHEHHGNIMGISEVCTAIEVPSNA